MENRRQCRRINRAISKYRIVTKDTFLTATVRLVAKLVVQRKQIGLIELIKIRYSVTQIYAYKYFGLRSRFHLHT